jgi:hypothetical protein
VDARGSLTILGATDYARPAVGDWKTRRALLRRQDLSAPERGTLSGVNRCDSRHALRMGSEWGSLWYVALFLHLLAGIVFQGRGGSGSSLSLTGLGASCSSDSVCASSHCVSGAFCETACDGVCISCDPTGHCTSTPPTDPRCPAMDCPADSACRSYQQGAAFQCVQFGECGSECTFTNQPQGTTCGSELACDGNGSCEPASPAGLALGAPCGADSACTSSHCVSGLCCDTVCDVACTTCDTTGHCVATPATDVRCPVSACPVDTACRSYQEPPVSTCSQFGQCSRQPACGHVETARGTSCDANTFCDGTGDCSLRANGYPCTADTDCMSGTCVAQHCGIRSCDQLSTVSVAGLELATVLQSSSPSGNPVGGAVLLMGDVSAVAHLCFDTAEIPVMFSDGSNAMIPDPPGNNWESRCQGDRPEWRG